MDDTPAVQFRLAGLNSVAVDSQGNAYIGVPQGIQRMDAATGMISTVIANGRANSPAPLAGTWQAPSGLLVDAQGRLVFFDFGIIYRLDTRTKALEQLNVPATAQFVRPSGLAQDPNGHLLLTDRFTHQIFRLDSNTRAITKVAGAVGQNPNPGAPSGDGGPATNAWLSNPTAITADPSGTIYFAEARWLRRIDGRTGTITSLLPITPTSPNGGSGDGGPYSQGVLQGVQGLATDSLGNLYVGNGTGVRKIDWQTGLISRVAGTGTAGPVPNDGTPAMQANLGSVTTVTTDRNGQLWIGDSQWRRLFRVDPSTGMIRSVAGTAANGDGGPARGAILLSTSSIAANTDGGLWIAGNGLRRVERATGIIRTVLASTGWVVSMAHDEHGFLYASTAQGILRIDPASGQSTLIPSKAEDGSVVAGSIAVERSGHLVIADTARGMIRRIDPANGTITTIAGNGTTGRYVGSVGPATQVSIGFPGQVAAAPNGDVLWTTDNYVLRLNREGKISVHAGNGGYGYTGDGGPATLASVAGPFALATDSAGNTFVSASGCRCVRRIAADTGIIQTVAGNGTHIVEADGTVATETGLNPGAITIGGDTLYVVERQTASEPERILAVRPAVPPALPQRPRITQFSNAVKGESVLSPGALFSIYGNYLALPEPASGAVGAEGRYGRSLGGTTVRVQGVEAPLLYASAGQINGVIPYAAGGEAIPYTLAAAGGTATSELGRMPSAALSFFPHLIINPDGTRNSESNPAPKGATLVLYGTGMGRLSPEVADGAVVNGPEFPRPIQKFTAHLQGMETFPAEILYLGPLPGFVAGAVQANIRIPESAPPGPVGLMVRGQDESLTETLLVYLLADAPVLTGAGPGSPIPQVLGQANRLELQGRFLNGIRRINFYKDGVPYPEANVRTYSCATTETCSVLVDFGGASGDFAVEVVNVMHQVSNRLPFALEPYGKPTIKAVSLYAGTGPIRANGGGQLLRVTGTNFVKPVTIDIYFGDTKIESLSSADTMRVFTVLPGEIHFNIDFLGKAGTYGIEVTSSAGGRSERFSFHVVVP